MLTMLVIIDANCGCCSGSGNKNFLAAIANILPDATIIGTKGTGGKSAVRTGFNISHVYLLMVFDSMSVTIYADCAFELKIEFNIYNLLNHVICITSHRASLKER